MNYSNKIQAPSSLTSVCSEQKISVKNVLNISTHLTSFITMLSSVIMVLIPQMALADTTDSEKTLTDALVHLTEKLSGLPAAFVVLGSVVGLICIGWGIFLMTQKGKDQQITWKGIAARVAVGVFLLSGIFHWLAELSNTIHGDTGQTAQEFVREQEANGKSDAKVSTGVSSCLKSGKDCRMY